MPPSISPPTTRARACSRPTTDETRTGEEELAKKLTILLALIAALALAGSGGAGASGSKKTAGSLTGAGSTFVSKLVQAWVPKVDGALGIKVTYGPIGSGGGIAQITNRTVDFGASDAPLTPDQFSACKGCVQIPWALSATSIAYNVSGVPSHLHMTGPVLARIYLGKITKWNDPAIKKLNPKIDLPSTSITPVYRSDGSGTTYNFTDYLTAVSKDWRTKVGNSTQVNFPTGIGAKGSSGVAGVVSRTDGSLTYVDVAYSLKNKLKFMTVRNNSGNWTLPGLRGIKAAASTIKKVPASN